VVTPSTATRPGSTTGPQAKAGRDWPSLVLVVLVPLALLRSTLRPIADPDTFWHLRAGEYLWHHWTFDGPEPWSAFSARPWVRHEWLPELAMAGANALGGLPGVAALTVAAVTALFVVLYRTCRHWAPVLPAGIAATAGAYGASASFAPRPQLVSFLLLAVVVGAWLRTCDDRRLRWWLIPVQWVWACSHGLWFVGIMVGAVCLVGLALERRGFAGLGKPALLVLGQTVVCALTPAGTGVFLALLRVNEFTASVTEWRASSLRDPAFAITVAAMGLVVVIWARSRTSVRWPHVALLGLAVLWALMYARTVALGAVISAPLVAMALQSLHPEESVKRVRGELASLVGAAVAVLVAAALVLPGVAREPEMPNALDARLDQLPAGTVLFNEYSLGGWLLWRHPDLSATVDPRVEVFDSAYVDAHVAAESAAPGWRGVVGDSGADYALLPTNLPLADALRDDRWSTVGTDLGYSLLKRP
jgi:hypothetical protein